MQMATVSWSNSGTHKAYQVNEVIDIKSYIVALKGVDEPMGSHDIEQQQSEFRCSWLIRSVWCWLDPPAFQQAK